MPPPIFIGLRLSAYGASVTCTSERAVAGQAYLKGLGEVRQVSKYGTDRRYHRNETSDVVRKGQGDLRKGRARQAREFRRDASWSGTSAGKPPGSPRREKHDARGTHRDRHHLSTCAR